MDVREIEGTTVRLEYVQDALGDHYVSVYIDGNLWDWHTFASREEAAAFMADPFKETRRINERRAEAELKRETESLGYFARDYTRISRGRKIGEGH